MWMLLARCTHISLNSWRGSLFFWLVCLFVQRAWHVYFEFDSVSPSSSPPFLFLWRVMHVRHYWNWWWWWCTSVYTWCSKIAAAATGRSVSSLLFGKCLLLCIQNTHTRMCVMPFETADYTHWYRVYVKRWLLSFFFFSLRECLLSLSCCAIAFAVSLSLS